MYGRVWKMEKHIPAEPCIYFRKIVGEDIESQESAIAWSFLIITLDQFGNYISADIGYWGAVDHAFDPIEVATRRVK